MVLLPTQSSFVSSPFFWRPGQAESYRTLAQQSEEKRARAEDELLTTARLAASLEARLAAAAQENEQLRLEVQVGGPTPGWYYLL